MEMPTPTKEHDFLQQLVGSWSSTGSCMMPDGGTSASSGTQTVHSLGGLWIVIEGRNDAAEGGGEFVLQLGFDPEKGKFVGTFIASMMTKLWIYEGTLDENGTVLTLAAEGPSFTGEGTALYHDIVEIEGPDSYLFSGNAQMPDGSWNRFMSSRLVRTG
jgi:hypothetical protein